MSNILTIAYTVEGSTDERFLGNIIQRTFEEVAFECDGDIEVYPIVNFKSIGASGFVENSKALAIKAFQAGIQVLCIHTDADSSTNETALRYKITPSVNAIIDLNVDCCKNIVAVVPIRMSEAWMLADKELLKDEIGTTKTDAALNIARMPERIADPKAAIENALRIAQEDLPKKRQNLFISALYQPLGQNLSLSKLDELNSYKHFRNEVINAFKVLNYLR